MRARLVAALFVCALTGTALPTHASEAFLFTTIPGTPAGINDAGQVVGSSGIYGFLRAPDGTYTAIDVPGETETRPLGINSSGQIVGEFGPLFKLRGFLRTATGVVTPLVVPGSNFTSAHGINRVGDIVGIFVVGPLLGGKSHGFLRARDGTFTTIDVLGAAHTEAYGINSAGQIVGVSSDGPLTRPPGRGSPFKVHGFIRTSADIFTTIDAPGAIGTKAYGINDAGQIVGTFWDTGDKPHGFLRNSDGTFTTIDVPGAIATELYGINGIGHLVGQFFDAGPHGFVASR